MAEIFGSLVQLRTVWEGVAGAPYYTTLWFDAGEGALQQAGEAWAGFLDTWHTSLVQGLRYTIESSGSVVNIASGQVTGVQTWDGATGTCTSTGQALPWQTQALIQLRTGLYSSGRELRGRVFVPGFTENDNDQGIFAIGNRSGFESDFAALLQNGVGAETGFAGTLAIYSRTHHRAAQVETVNVPAQWSALRSRRG